MGKGFLGTPASLMLDVVVVSLVAIGPALLFGLYLARWRKNYALHKIVMVGISLALFAVVALFEIDMRMQGGFWAMAKASPYAATAFLRNLLAVHLVFSVSTLVMWIATFASALAKFSKPPAPGPFSQVHKVMAWASVADMVGTIVTGLMVYYYGFWVS